MKVTVHLYSQSQPVERDKIRNCYTKDGLYCLLRYDGTVDKFPVQHIFRIREMPDEFTTEMCKGSDEGPCLVHSEE